MPRVSRPQARTVHRASGEQPPLPHPAGDERADGERERHREPHVAEIEHRRMECHEDVVLQQRVGARTVVAHRRVERTEGRRGTDHQQEEEPAHHEQGQHRPADHRVGGPVAELHDDGHHVAAQDQGPQQDRALERRPQRGDVEQRGGGRRPVIGDERHREVAGDQRPFHHHDRTQRRQGHHAHEPAGLAHPVAAFPGEAGGDNEHAGDRRREPERDRGRPESAVAHVSSGSVPAWPPRSASVIRSSYSSSLM